MKNRTTPPKNRPVKYPELIAFRVSPAQSKFLKSKGVSEHLRHLINKEMLLSGSHQNEPK